MSRWPITEENPEKREQNAQLVEDVETCLTQSGLEFNSALAFLHERFQQYIFVEMKLLAQQRDLRVSLPYIIYRFTTACIVIRLAKIPDIEKCLDVVATLQAKRGTGELALAVPSQTKPHCSCTQALYPFLLKEKIGVYLIFYSSLHKNSNNHPTLFQLGGVSCMDQRHQVFARKNHAQYWFSSSDSKALTADLEVLEGIYSRACIEDIDTATGLLQKNLDNAKASLEVLIADLQYLRDQVTITLVTIARVYRDVQQR
ncbi:hypothetical protein VNO77_05601 [Canavalia gladiata]|uniref:Uncharacterized protein n=1 Tax=Canavalia gladiata TaxID=3824 RepID=A0AAN9N3W9_CANGL